MLWPPKKPPPDDPEQSRRFIDMAREVEADGGEGSENVFAETDLREMELRLE